MSSWRCRRGLLLTLFLAALALTGCATQLKVDRELIKGFSKPAATAPGESLVYVIRQSTMLGAARGLYVALNDQIVANIASGSYCYFTTTGDINTVNLEQVSPFGYQRLDDLKGDDVFLYFEMTTGKFTKLDKDLGMTAVMQSTLAPPLKAFKENAGYSSALMNPGFMDLYLMKENPANLMPDSEHAVITFVRPQTFANDMAMGIWGEQGFIGNLKGQTYLQVKVPAGMHSFIANSEHFAVLQAEVAAGKNYFVEASVNMGWAQGHYRLMPVKQDVAQSTIDEWLKTSKRLDLDTTAINATVKKRFDLAIPLIKEALQKVRDNKAEARQLALEDGRKL